MKQNGESANPTRKEADFELYRTTVKDARYILKQYGDVHPTEALEAIRRILFNPKLHLK